MTKFTRFKMLLMALVMLVGSGNVWGQGSEDFTNLPTASSTSYQTRSWTGTNGVTWSAAGARTDQTLTGKAICWNTSGTRNVISPTYSGGMGTLTFKYVRGFTGTNARSLEVYVNSIKIGSTITVSPTSDVVVDYSSVINVSGDVVLEIRSTGAAQVKVDDISWTAYAGGGTPVVATPTITPSGVAKTTDTYYNTARVTLESATSGASIYYTLNGDVPTSGSTLYSVPFDITSTKTIKAIAVKDAMDNSTVAEKTITIVAPATATVPYTEAFNNTLGDWYKIEVAGAKPWGPSANGATVNGYQGGDVESWLISPKFTATEAGLALSFNYATSFAGNSLLIKFSNDYIGYGSPSDATWTDLTSLTAVADSYTLKATGEIVAATTGTVYFALVYDAAAAPYSDWRITNASVDLPSAGPTITVTEATVPAMTAHVGATDTETITVSGQNLEGSISLAVTGTDYALFELSTNTIAPTGGTVTDVVVTITYTPNAAGSHTATLTLSSAGAESVVKTLTGSATWPPLAAPVADAAGAISQSGFTAIWGAVSGATSYEVNVYTKVESGGNATDLFISEYVEGSSSNKYIEIYNGTGSSVDLSDYKLELYPNGGAVNPSTTLSGTLANGATKVYKNSSATLTLPEGVTAENNSAVNFNGDDAIALYKISSSSFVDIFGRIGSDPGAAWTADGGYTTVDKTLRRKSSVISGITVNPTGTGVTAFTTLGTEWDLYNTDVVTDLGSHTFAGGGSSITPVSGSPFAVTGETSKAITGLSASTTYYYTVVAKNAHVDSDASNEISVVTSFGTDVTNPELKNITAFDGKIRFSATAGQQVEVYNAVGQKLISAITLDGLNTLSVNAKGMMIVKVGDRLAKVIL